MKKVRIELDPKKDGTFIARKVGTGEILAEGGVIDTYVPAVGKKEGTFTFKNFREVGSEPPPAPVPKPPTFELKPKDRDQVISIFRKGGTKNRAIKCLLARYPGQTMELCKNTVDLVIKQEKL